MRSNPSSGLLSLTNMNNDEHQEDYNMASEARKNADKMSEGNSPFKKKEKVTSSGTAIEQMRTSEIFTYLKAKVQNEQAQMLIELAHNEYKDLSKRITEEVARKQVGNLIVTAINAKLSSAESTESGKAKTRVFKKAN